MRKILVLAITGQLVLILCSCENKPSLVGLWVVKSVTAGADEITPNARWMRFNADHTQQSGNGWFQHSVGTWNVDQHTNELTIYNSNGLNDLNEPFKIKMDQNTMEWSRVEEGQAIRIKLERADQLPAAYGDKILGLWKLAEDRANGGYLSPSEALGSYIFFRWDKRFEMGTDNGKLNGVYNVHGHRPELELIPYGEPLKREFWAIGFEGDSITLRLLNTDRIVTRTFKRIHEFPKE